MSENSHCKGALGPVTAICSSLDVIAGELGVRFEVTYGNESFSAFVIRHSRGINAYINRCSHQALELDWDLGHFFDLDQRYLICASHGALYAADSGQCVAGPCNGSGLEALPVVEKEGTIYLKDSRYVVYCREAKTQD
jgi:nitrite reductase/ring-hydroxylating ferredoxin subunit